MTRKELLVIRAALDSALLDAETEEKSLEIFETILKTNEMIRSL